MKVKCPSCKRLCNRTTDKYNPDIRPNGSMIDLLDPWRSWWGKGDGFTSADLECPLCGAPLAPAGRLHVVPDDYGVVKVLSLEEANQNSIALLFTEDDEEDTAPDTGEPISKADQIRDMLVNTDMTVKAIADQISTSVQYVRNVAAKGKG